MTTGPILISGEVKDDKNNPVAEARISFIDGPVPLQDIATVSDDNGRFILSAPVPGEYTIEVVSEGFISKNFRFATEARRGSRFEIKLSRELGQT